MALWLWVKGYRRSCPGPMQGQIAFQRITRKLISISCQTFPISVCNLKSRDFRDYAVHMGNNQTFKVFPDNNGKGTSTLLAVNVIVHLLFLHKDRSFSGEHSHPERIQWSLWHCTHINQGHEFCLCLIVCVASLQGWRVFMSEKEQVRVREKYSTHSPTRSRQTSVLHYFRGLLYWCLPVTLNRA